MSTRNVVFRARVDIDTLLALVAPVLGCKVKAKSYLLPLLYYNLNIILLI